ncbi:CG12684 [Drosophila busckii]|uniref:CG12684 n=1 Tax=Drosophila busckii TaxID=30019 RepID=A0A0M4EWL7_DROBS|nr:uncharacterized protein LOC108595762 [Drosophila busckii]ALC42512.1 CG12684 [Drosophila busckii]
MSTSPKDTQYLRCLKCLKIIKCSRYDTSGLVRHVQMAHPEIIDSASEKKLQNLHKLAAEHGISDERLSQISKMTGMSEVQMADEAERYLAKQQAKKGGGGSKAMPTTQQQQQKSSCAPKAVDSRDLNKRHIFRSSIERWLPTDGCIYCPNCGANRAPLLKSSAELGSGCCASLCIANCFPFCFLPCLSSGDNREYLYCCNCKSFLGIYDRENNCIRPNREFISSCDDGKGSCNCAD